MLINLSNHPSTLWCDKQTQAAKQFGKCVDLPFPKILSDGDEVYIADLVEEYYQKIMELLSDTDIKNITVHLMGEMTFTYALVKRLTIDGIRCIASTTERNVVEYGNGQKESQFQFVRFREYSNS
ncbi:MAG: hypothetical protein BGO29_14145 [Bacteroidales bacterium 36-12]|nr:MAG: hypothetical protein BGO29_14145 [Bacteroidales bacterium 36-12]